jgi:small subunit ribosomal protein S6
VTEEEVKILAQYELMYILKPDLGEEQTQADIERFNDALIAQDSTIIKVDKWGRRKLAYEINNLTEGFYMVVTFEGSGDVSNEITRVLKIHDDVVRSIVVRMDE